MSHFVILPEESCHTSGCLSQDKTVIVVSVFADDACDFTGGTGGLSTMQLKQRMHMMSHFQPFSTYSLQNRTTQKLK